MAPNARMKTTESYRISQILKRRILKKHIILSNINFGLKIAMLLFVLSSMIFFAIVSSGVLFKSPDTKHLIELGKLSFVWPVILSGIVFVGEISLLFFINEKRKFINLNFSNNGYGNVTELNKLTIKSIIAYSISFVFIVIMFGCWFHIIDISYGAYDQAHKPDFEYYLPIIGSFYDIFVGLYSAMMVIEAAIIASLVTIYIYNNRYKETLSEVVQIASKEMQRMNIMDR